MMSETYDKDLFDLLERIYASERKREFVPGKTTIHYAWAIYDHHEVFAALNHYYLDGLESESMQVNLRSSFQTLLGQSTVCW